MSQKGSEAMQKGGCMKIKGAKTIAEYAIRRWLIEQGFSMEHFELSMDEKEGKLIDQNGDSMILVYDPGEKSVYIKD